MRGPIGPNVIPVVSFIGHHDSGKTRVVRDVITLLVARGYRVGTVKHAPELEDVDRAGSDSDQHLAAGATRVLLQGARTSALFWNHEGTGPDDEWERWFAGCDVVLVEGHKRGPWPKIEVFRRGRDLRREPLAGEIDVVAVVTEEHVALPDGVALFSPREREELVAFLETLLFGEPPVGA